MKKITYTILVILISSICTFIYATNIAVVAGLKGKISLIRNNKTSVLKQGEILQNNDELRSSEESFAAIRFVDNGATTKLFPNSIMVISAQEAGNQLQKRNTIVKGTAQSKVTPQTGHYIIETPNTVASVKGTEFIVTFDGGKTFVGVKEGEVEIESKGSGKKTTAGKDEVYEVDENGNVDEQEDSDYIENNEEEGQQLNAPAPQGNYLDIEIQKADGTKKKVRIHYE